MGFFILFVMMIVAHHNVFSVGQNAMPLDKIIEGRTVFDVFRKYSWRIAARFDQIENYIRMGTVNPLILMLGSDDGRDFVCPVHGRRSI